MIGSFQYQANRIWYQIDGITQSKKEFRENSEHKGQNGHQVSEFVHSTRSKKEIINRAKELGKYVHENFNNKDMQGITNEMIKAYIQSKIDKGLKYRSISTYISQLEKIQVGLSKMKVNRPWHENLFDRKGLIEARKMAKKYAPRSVHRNRSYSNPYDIKKYISIRSKIALELQLEVGVRVREARVINGLRVLSDNKIKVIGKGGYRRTFKISSDLYLRVNNFIKQKGSYYLTYNQYYYDLKKAVKLSGQKWNATHGLRYNYVQREIEKLVKRGMSYDEALLRVSYEIGHHRKEITRHYQR